MATTRVPVPAAPATRRMTTTLLGPVELSADDVGLTAVHLAAPTRPRDTVAAPAGAAPPDVARASERAESFLDSAQTQLLEYLFGERTSFDVPLHVRGTPFQRSVWAALDRIPFGSTWSYRELAASLGRPAATRAVGAACGRNPVAIVVPCHRVVGADGSLTGYAGGTAAKASLLALEARTLAADAAPVLARLG